MFNSQVTLKIFGLVWEGNLRAGWGSERAFVGEEIAKVRRQKVARQDVVDLDPVVCHSSCSVGQVGGERRVRRAGPL